MPLRLPKVNISEQQKERFANLIKNKGLLAALQFLCPLEFSFKILANVKKSADGDEHHDLALLYQLEAALMPPVDLEDMLYQLLAERGSSLEVHCARVKYDGQEYNAVFIDRPKAK